MAYSRGCLRLRVLAAAVEGGECGAGGGGSRRWARMSSRRNYYGGAEAVESCAVLSAPARVARARGRGLWQRPGRYMAVLSCASVGDPGGERGRARERELRPG